MYERFTNRAHCVMQRAEEEARRLNHEHVGTVHVLMGLAKAGSGGVAQQVLSVFGVDLRKIRIQIEAILEADPDWLIMGDLHLTQQAKKVVQYATQEASSLSLYSVGTEHLLLGLLHDDCGTAAYVLRTLGLELEAVREQVRFLLLVGTGPPIETEAPPSIPPKPTPAACPKCGGNKVLAILWSRESLNRTDPACQFFRSAEAA
jgi:ATP-dependent Clp protease ATP-binding subunit ClpC